MAAEIRTIIFEREEVVEAVTAFRRRKGTPLPPGEVFKFVLRHQPSISLALAFALKNPERLENIEIDAPELGAALVMFCLDSKIPLPAKGATKRLQLFGESIGLVVSINTSSQQLEGFLNIL